MPRCVRRKLRKMESFAKPRRFRCRICGSDLQEQESTNRCTFCGQEETSQFGCPKGHYTCERCRVSQPPALVEKVCLSSKCSNPLELAVLIMCHSSFQPYGCEHHILAAPVLLATLRNCGVPGISDEKIRDSISRLAGIPVSVCGTRGDCGAAASAGTVFSILRAATPFSDNERSVALRATAAVLEHIADHGGPRCCKQSVFDAICYTWNALRAELGLEALPGHHCAFAGTLKDCKGKRCPYFE